MNSLKYQPNITHIKLAELENKGKLKAVITQNIDGLHQKAGSKVVYELHGSVLRNYCMNCHKFYDAEYVFNSNGIPRCSCGGIIKPDLLIVAGTSLTVQPASGLINFFRGRNLVLINRNSTPYDNKANLVINDSLGKVFSKL